MLKRVSPPKTATLTATSACSFIGPAAFFGQRKTKVNAPALPTLTDKYSGEDIVIQNRAIIMRHHDQRGFFTYDNEWNSYDWKKSYASYQAASKEKRENSGLTNHTFEY